MSHPEWLAEKIRRDLRDDWPAADLDERRGFLNHPADPGLFDRDYWWMTSHPIRAWDDPERGEF